MSLHPCPSLITNGLNLPFRTQGRSRRLKEAYRQEIGNTEGFLCPGAPQGPAQFSQLAFNFTYFVFHIDYKCTSWDQKDMGLNLTSATYKQLYSKYLDNLLWLRRDNYNEVENLVLGSRGWINLGRGNSTYFSVLSLCLKKILCIKELLKLLFPMNHYPPSFMAITSSVMIIYCMWSSVVAGAPVLTNTKKPMVHNSSQSCVQHHTSHLILPR